MSRPPAAAEQSIERLEAHPQREAFARLVRAVATSGEPPRAAAERLGLEAVPGTTAAAVVGALESGPATEVEQRALADLLAHALGVAPTAPETEVAAALRWLARLPLATPGAAPRIDGEWTTPPRGALATAALAACGWLLVAGGARLVGRAALGLRRPAEVRLTAAGVEVRTRTEVLGKVLRERDVLLPVPALARASRDVRFPGLPTYAGLLALLAGSWFGAGLLFDGARAASPSMALAGVVVVALGLGIDLALTSLMPGARGRCRLVLVPRRGPTVCVGAVDRATADRFLAALAGR